MGLSRWFDLVFFNFNIFSSPFLLGPCRACAWRGLASAGGERGRERRGRKRRKGEAKHTNLSHSKAHEHITNATPPHTSSLQWYNAVHTAFVTALQQPDCLLPSTPHSKVSPPPCSRSHAVVQTHGFVNIYTSSAGVVAHFAVMHAVAT